MVDPKVEEPKPIGAARDIRLEVSGGDQRVEVKLTERAGQVQVAVRTPDSHLADRLRESLPSLTSHLAENGIRAETWRPTATISGEHHFKELPQTSSADSSAYQQRQNPEDQQKREDRRPAQQPAAEKNQSKEKGKDFAWLMSTMR
jgi:flagellar hook-length control protein FliK